MGTLDRIGRIGTGWIGSILAGAASIVVGVSSSLTFLVAIGALGVAVGAVGSAWDVATWVITQRGPKPIEATVAIPLALDHSPGRALALMGRDEELARLRETPGDLIIVGRPGTGKSRLASHTDRVRFLTNQASPQSVAESLKRHKPRHVVVDDAGLAIGALEVLLELRRKGHAFAIVATTWPENLAEVRRWLGEAVVIELTPLERPVINQLIEQLGILNYYLRGEILDQAQGRPGWAVALADLAKRGDVTEVLSGRGLVAQVEPYLTRLGASSVASLGLLSVIAALGDVTLVDELREVNEFVSLGRLQGEELLQQAAAAGVLERRSGSLRIAPEPLRHALVAYWFYEQSTAPWSLHEVLARWPNHRSQVIEAGIGAAETGSENARRDLEGLVGSIADVAGPTVDRYVALDEVAASRAIREVLGADTSERIRLQILSTAAKRYALPMAVRALLDSAIGDERPEHSNPDHPIRVLGEVGSRVDPLGRTSFEARASILTTANQWLDDDAASVPRQVAWAKLATHLLDPEVEGNYTDPAAPMTVQLRAGFESPEHLRTLTSDFWELVRPRLALLSSQALLALVEVAEDWARVWRRYQGRLGTKPTVEASEIARGFLDHLLPALAAACVGKPAAQMQLHERMRFLGVHVHQTIDTEFRILSWEPWHLPKKGKSGLLTATVGRLADRWAAEKPADLMGRVRYWSDQAAIRQKTLHPMVYVVFQALAERSEDLDGLVRAGLDAGLTWELESLFRAAVDSSTMVPGWLMRAAAGPARMPALSASLESRSNRAAVRAAIRALVAEDQPVIEQAVIRRMREGPDWVCRCLLHHPIAAVRGIAALWFGLDPSDHAALLPESWYPSWAAAFLVASAEDRRGRGNHRLGEQLKRLVDRDPNLVEAWLSRALSTATEFAMYDLPPAGQASLMRLPHEHKERLLRNADGASTAEFLRCLLGDDIGWLEQLLEEGTIDVNDVMSTLHDGGRDEIPARVQRALDLARLVVPRGVRPATLARTPQYGSWWGEESDHFEAIRAAFEAAETHDPAVEEVRSAGMEYFERCRDEARVEERARRVSGDL